MKKDLTRTIQILIVACSVLALTGCTTVISAVGTGVAMTAEYVMEGSVAKTVSYELGRIKKSLLVALCKMGIKVDSARQIEGGEEIVARAHDLEINIELKQITPMVTRIKVKANKNFFQRDKATAQEIVNQTNMIAENLTS
jgi:hypothetical protein